MKIHCMNKFNVKRYTSNIFAFLGLKVFRKNIKVSISRHDSKIALCFKDSSFMGELVFILKKEFGGRAS